MGYTMLHITNADKEFYRLMGPYLSRRHIVRELGNTPVWDDDRRHWWIAVDDTDAEVGFAAADEHRESVHFPVAYVLPAHRRRGVYAALFAERAQWAGDRLITACASPESLPVFLRHGFAVIGTRGKRFSRVRREPGGDTDV